MVLPCVVAQANAAGGVRIVSRDPKERLKIGQEIIEEEALHSVLHVVWQLSQNGDFVFVVNGLVSIIIPFVLKILVYSHVEIFVKRAPPVKPFDNLNKLEQLVAIPQVCQEA